MKELIVGLAAGMIAGFAIGMSDCGKSLASEAKKKLKCLCSCAEKELDKMKKGLDDNVNQDANSQNSSCNCNQQHDESISQ